VAAVCGDDDDVPDSNNAPIIDYDVWARLVKYVRSVPPVLLHVDEETVGVDAKFRVGAPVQLRVGTVVFLCDHDWLLAERARLISKFRAAVRVTTIVIHFVRPLTREVADPPRLVAQIMRSMRNLSAATVVEAGAARDEDTGAYVGADGGRRFRYRRFIGVRSGSTRAGNVIGLLPPRATVRLDEGTFLGEQLALEVTPLPPQRTVTSAAGRDDANRQCGCARRRQDGASDRVPFPFVHPSLGCSGAHVRRCVIVQGCEVRGLERMQVASLVWGRFLLRGGSALLGSALRGLMTCCCVRGAARRRRRRHPALLSESAIEELLHMRALSDRGSGGNSLAAGTQVNYARYDQLRREIRIIVLRRARRGHATTMASPDRASGALSKLRTTGYNQLGDAVAASWRPAATPESVLDQLISDETARLMARFEEALDDVDPREASGYRYTPHPVDTSRVKLPSGVLDMCELIAENCHEVWSVGRIAQGWRWGPVRDNARKLHPDLIPYSDLTEETKQYDRDTAFASIKVVLAMGYVVEKSAGGGAARDPWVFGQRAAARGETYVPRPFPSTEVTLPRELQQLAELLAENTHEIWAVARKAQGWVFGPSRDDARKRHNGLVPYFYL
jgi:hypothetical protein